VRVPDDLVLSPGDSLVEAQRLLDEGLPFHAHEVLEARWKAAPDAERDLWQGLAQLAVGLTHALRGNTAGAATLLTRGADRLSGYVEEPPYGVDVTGLLDWARSLAGRLRDSSRDVGPLSAPRLCRT
jgi:predicted metal-dependent hydrolase